MASEIQDDLQAFHRFVGEQLANGGASFSPEECLELWRAEHPTPADLADSVASVQRALEEADRGEGIPLEDFDREFRRKHDISQDG